MHNRKKAFVPYESNVFNMKNSVRCSKYSVRYFRTGFGLIGLLITLAIIAFASWTTYSLFLKQKNGGETPMEQGLSAINEAEKAKQLLEQRNIVTEPDTPNNLSSVHVVKVGDTIGNFTIKSINIFPFIYPDDKSQDFTVELGGEETVGGTVFWNDMFKQPCFMVSKGETHKIPQFKEWNNPQAHFCFKNAMFAQEELKAVPGATSSATILIRDYKFIFSHKEGDNETTFVRFVH